MVRLNEQLTEAFWPPSHAPPRFLVRERALVEDTYQLADESSFHEQYRSVIEEPDSDPSRSVSQSVTPVPDPADDVDALEELEEEITTLAAHIHAATHRLLILIADFDRRRGWELGGHRTCAHWLSFRTGIDLGAAREKVRTARVLVGLPLTSASMARGELSFSKVRAISRVATEANEKELLPFAQKCTTAHLERMVRGFKRGSRKDEAALERERHESRALSVFPDDEGMYVIKGRLPAEVGALVMRAVEAASDALYREKREPRLETDTEREKAAAQRRADALGLLAERALAVGFGGKGRTDGESDAGCWGDDGVKRTEGAEAGCSCAADDDEAHSHPIPISGSRAERFQVMLHVEPETLRADAEPGCSELEDGTRVAPALRSAVSRIDTVVVLRVSIRGRSAQLKRPGGSPAMRGWSG